MEKKTFAEAFVALQGAIKPAIKDATNPAFRSKYADLGAVWEAVREPLTQNGFAIIQSPDFDDKDMWLKTIILHVSGEKMEGRYPLRPTKQDPQGFGSALTYAKRYSIAAMLGVVADDDDDGNAASSKPVARSAPAQPQGPITSEQLDTITDLLVSLDADVPKFCRYMGVEAIKDLPASKYQNAIEALNMKGQKK